jgi:RHS repeat-associated protein
VTDPAGRVVSYERDAAGRLRTVTAPDAGTATFGYDAAGRLETITSPRGFTTRFGYDSAHRVTTVTRQHTADPWGPAYPDAVTRFAYTGGQTVVTDANGHDATYRLDSAGRVTAATDALGRTRSQTWTANSDVATTTDAMGSGTTPGNTATLSYDALNNNTGVSLPTGAAASAAYGTGTNCATTATTNRYQPKCTTDDAGNKQGLSYDAAGNLTRVTDTTSGGTGAVTANYVRDNAAGSVCGGKAGMVCSSTDGNGNTTTYRYDPDGNLTSVDPPGPLGTTTYSYDTIGRLTAVVDGNGQRTTYEYDAADRLLGTYFDGGGEFWTGFYADGTLDYEWDSAAAGIWWHHTDSLGRTYAKMVHAGVPADEDILTTVHDGVGNLLSYSDSDGTVTYRYDAANQLTSITEPGGACPASGAPAPGSGCTQFSYDRNGAETARIFPGGARQDTTRDNAERPTRISAKNAAGTVISDIGYSYTAAGGTGATADRTLVQRRTHHKEAGIAAGAVTSYGYDSLGRLTAATERTGATTAASWAYTYDKAGNRLTQTRTGTTGAAAGTVTTSYNAAHQITAGTGDTATWTYDGTGQQTRNGATGATASYGDRHQLLSTAGAAFAYFGPGNTERISGTPAGGSTEYIHSALGLASQWNGAMTYYTRDPDGALVSARTDGGGSQYYLTDHLGSVLGLLDATGAQVAAYSYDPYGATRTANGPAAAANPHRYIGGYLDTTTGLYKLGARYYDPTLGRFTQMDPSGQEANDYVYAESCPTSRVDPTGLRTYTVTVQCQVVNFFLGTVVGHVRGTGRANSMAQAVNIAQKNANRHVPAGHYKRHCKVIATPKNVSGRSGFWGPLA